MLKPASLRKAIVDALPDLRKKPDDLRIFVRKGRIISRAGPALGFQYRFTLMVELLEFAGNPDTLMAAVVLWLRRHQPDLIQSQGDRSGFRFDVDQLSPTVIDVVIEMDLDESVTTTPREGGGWDLVHIAEPKTEDVFNPMLDEDLGRPLLTEIYLGGLRLVPDPASEGE